MGSVAFSYNNGVITLTALPGGKACQLQPGHPAYNEVKRLLKEPNNTAAIVAAIEATQNRQVSSDVVVKGGKVYYRGKQVHNLVATRINEFNKNGLPTEPLVKFLELLMQNPSYQSINEAYEFLENKNLPITEDGHFLAYKAIRENWFDKWTGTLDNHPGNYVEMPRNAVEDTRSKHCAPGLHCGAMDYVTWYGRGDDRIIIVKVNPAHIVSVPSDSNCMKMRVHKYYVVEEYTGDLIKPLYTADAAPVPTTSDIDDEGWSPADDAAAGVDKPHRYLDARKVQGVDYPVFEWNPNTEIGYWWVGDGSAKQESIYRFDTLVARKEAYSEITREQAIALLKPVESKSHCAQGCKKNYRHSKRGPDGKFIKRW